MAHSFVPLPLPGLCHSLLFSNRKLWTLVEGHEGLRGALGTCATLTSSLQGVCPPRAHLTRAPAKPWGKSQMPSRARETGGNMGLTLSSLDGTCPTVPRLQPPGRAGFSEEALPCDTARSRAPFGEGGWWYLCFGGPSFFPLCIFNYSCQSSSSLSTVVG